MNISYSHDLLDSLNAVIAVAGEFEPRPNLNAIHWHITPTKLILTGTDGYMLIEETLPEPAENELSALLPIRDMETLAALMKDMPGADVQIVIDYNEWHFTLHTTTLVVYPLDIEQPNYEGAWQDKEGDLDFRINTSYLLRVLAHAPDHIQIQLTNSNTAVRIIGRNFRAAVMPMSLASARAALGEGQE